MRLLTFGLITIFMIFGITFGLLNAKPVMVHYYLGQRELPLSILLIGLFIASFLSGFILSLFGTLRVKFENRRLRKRLSHIESEVSRLKTACTRGINS